MALAQSRIVLTVSDYAATEVCRTLGVRRDRIRVAVEAAASVYQPSDSCDDVVAAARRAGVPDGRRWFAYVGGFNPHKHVDAIVRAHAELMRDLADPPYLVLVGALDDDPFFGSQQRIRDEIARCGTTDQVKWAGYVPDDELRHLHSGALALVMPSESEGFGLPAVEAAACGIPVIATRESPLPQLLEGGGIFVAPRDEIALSSAMRRLATDEPYRREARGDRTRPCARPELGGERTSRTRRAGGGGCMTAPLRFCMFSTFYPPYSYGGDGITLQRLCRALVRAGHEVTVVHDADAYLSLGYPPPGDVRPDDGVEVVTLRSSLGLASVLLTHQFGRPVVHGAQIEALLSRGNFDVVHFHNVSLVGGPGLFALARRLGDRVHGARTLARLPDARPVAPSHESGAPAANAFDARSTTAVRRSSGETRACSSGRCRMSTRSSR